MKKWLGLIVAFVVFFTFSSTSSALDYFEKYKVSVKYNGVVQDFSPNAVIWSNYTIVPFRQLFELHGADVKWDNETKTVTATKGDTTIKLKGDSNIAFINGNEVKLAQGSLIANGTLYVGLRFVSEALGAEVSFDKKNMIVNIMTEEQ